MSVPGRGEGSKAHHGSQAVGGKGASSRIVRGRNQPGECPQGEGRGAGSHHGSQAPFGGKGAAAASCQNLTLGPCQVPVSWEEGHPVARDAVVLRVARRYGGNGVASGRIVRGRNQPGDVPQGVGEGSRAHHVAVQAVGL